MTDKVIIEEVVPEDAPEEVKGILKQVGDGIAKLFQKAQDAEPEVTEGDDQEPAPVETPPDPAPTQAPPAAASPDLEKILKAQTDRFEAMLKAQKAEFSEQLTKMDVELKKANERAEKAEKYATEQTVQAEKQAAIQKALSYKAMPVEPGKLGSEGKKKGRAAGFLPPPAGR